MAAGVGVVAGVGPGLGLALVRCFAREGLAIAALARDEAKLRDTVGDSAHAYACDVADAAAVTDTFDRIAQDLGAPDLVVFNAGAYVRGGALELSSERLEAAWRVGCLGGFHVAQAAARPMLERGRGTLLFTGATASLRGSAGFAALAIPKFGLRALAQSLARELGPKGVHVAHVIIDGGIGEPGLLSGASDRPDASLDPQAIADAYWQLHQQHRSAWTHELDLRPWVERF